jgi:glycosyltransferase involved in cell wall biosynthesis
MQPRTAATSAASAVEPLARTPLAVRSAPGRPPSRDRRSGGARAICLLPAHNEGANLPTVLAELQRCRPDLDVLVVDDGSTDGTADLLERLDVKWLRLPERMGIGSAMRAGLRYASRLGYDIVVRMDGDGQHRPDDIQRLLEALEVEHADVVLGSRYVDDGGEPREAAAMYGGARVQNDARRPAGASARLIQRLLAACLCALTGKRVTDPTSGFYGLGPRAVRVLAEHHPTGYPEPELRLFLSRNALKTIEVPVCGRARPGGRTSLTAGRITAAGARVLLAMIIVPLRHRVGLARD